MFGGLCHYRDNFRNYLVSFTKITINIMPRKHSTFVFDYFLSSLILPICDLTKYNSLRRHLGNLIMVKKTINLHLNKFV